MRWLAPLLLAATLSAEVAVTASGAALAEIDHDRVRDILLGRVTTWPDGRPIIIVLSEADADDRALLAIVGRDRQRLMRGWKRLVFSGNGSMPVVVPDARAAGEFVARTPGAMAVLAASPPAGGAAVRVVPIRPTGP
jgi:hypothetical protein